MIHRRLLSFICYKLLLSCNIREDSGIFYAEGISAVTEGEVSGVDLLRREYSSLRKIQEYSSLRNI